MPCFMYIKKKLLASLYLTRSYTIHIVPLNDEILNLWNDFRFIVEYLKSVEGIIKLIESI